MAFINFKKESSERSDPNNWVKAELLTSQKLYLDSIEGCNENDQNQATHLFDRLSFEYDSVANIPSTEQEVLDIILQHEQGALTRKLNFAALLGCEYDYIFYDYNTEHVYRYRCIDDHTCILSDRYDTFAAFSQWIQRIKVWTSRKPFREFNDLPEFDKKLRSAGCAWPTNIDCIVSNNLGQPISIVEFQNADDTGVANHNSNRYFLPYETYENSSGYTNYKTRDFRRWLSQEILRVQSGLQLLVFKWSVNDGFALARSVNKICFPDYPYDADWDLHKRYNKLLHSVITEIINNGTCTRETFSAAASSIISYTLECNNGQMQKVVHNPPLSGRAMTFPSIYLSGASRIERGSVVNVVEPVWAP